MTPGKPLAGLTVAVTRSREQAGKLAEALEAKGARVVAFPTIAIHASDEAPPFHQHTKYDWTVFASANAVNYFAEKVGHAGFDLSKLNLGRVCAVGPATQDELTRRGIAAEPLPEEYTAEAVFDYVKAQDPEIARKRVLLPRGNIARDMILFAFRSSGATVTPWIVYVNEPVVHDAADIAGLLAANPGLVTFTSASTARNFCQTLGARGLEAIKKRAAFASIGPQTTEAAVAGGLNIAIEPAQHDIPGLVAAIVYWSAKLKGRAT